VHGVYGRLAALVVAGQLVQPVAAEYPLTKSRPRCVMAGSSARGGKVLLKF
jgi:hypothetical protein